MAPPLFRTRWVPLLAALAVALPTLGMGLFGDDHVHRALLEGAPAPFVVSGSRWDLFRFASGDAAEVAPHVAHGPLPWWTVPGLKLAFWRPLSSASAVLDDVLFGRSAVAAHAQSVLWYLALVAMCGVLLRRLVPGVAALALLVFAVDDAHFGAVAWLANRNALVAATPALLGLWLHLEWRERGRRAALPLSALALGLGLLGGETAVGVFAYVLAYEALGAQGPWRERARALIPALAVGGVWLGTYRALGYGAWGSGAYLDPGVQPVEWLLSAPGRALALAGGLVLGVPSELHAFAGLRPWLAVAAVAGGALLAWLLRAAWPTLDAEARRHVRWLLAGAALSLAPLVSTAPSNRLLLVPSLGVAVAVAVALSHAWRTRHAGPARRWGVLAGGGLLALLHMVLAPAAWPVGTLSLRSAGQQNEQLVEEMLRTVEAAKVEGKRVVVLALPQPVFALYAPAIWWARGGPTPRAWWTLSMADELPAFVRTGPSSFELALDEARFLESDFERNFRSAAFPLAAGDTVALEGLAVKVLDADARGPKRLGFTFDVPLEDPSLALFQWKDGAPRPFVPPPVGTRLELAEPTEP